MTKCNFLIGCTKEAKAILKRFCRPCSEKEEMKETLTLKTLGKLYQEAKKAKIDGDLVIERFSGIILNWKFPFIHRLVAINLKEKLK